VPIDQSGPCPQPQDLTIPKFNKESLESLKDTLRCKPRNSNSGNTLFQYIKKGKKREASDNNNPDD